VRTNESIHPMKTLIAANRIRFNLYIDGYRLTLADAYTELAAATDWDAHCYWRSMVRKGEALRAKYEREANNDLLRQLGGPR
jgi:hypothetical protein